MPRHAEIAGAGLAGLTAAAALCRRGWTARVHERMPSVRIVGSGLSIFENGLRVLKAVDAEDDSVRDARRGLVRETRDAYGNTTSQMSYSGRMYEITRKQVASALAAAAERAGAEIVTGSTAIAADPEGVLHLENGRSMKADLVLAADGIHSRVRDSLRLPMRRQPLADGAIRIMIPRSVEEAQTPDGKMNVEYWSGTRRILVAGCSDTELYVALTALDSDSEAKTLPIKKNVWKKSFPFLDALIDRLDGEARWDRFETVKMPRWSSGRVVVLGDAAHAMAPNLGQGGACAMMNALALAVELETAQDVPAALTAWEQRERPLTDHTQRWSTFYSALTTWPDRMRSLAFATVTGVPWLRKQPLRAMNHIPTGTT